MQYEINFIYSDLEAPEELPFRYHFNGVDQYATMPQWQPSAASWEIEVEVDAVDPVAQGFLKSDADDTLVYINTTQEFGAQIGNSSDYAKVLPFNITDNSLVKVKCTNHNFKTIVRSLESEEYPVGSNPISISTIGNGFKGVLYSLKLTDLTDVQDRNIVSGNATDFHGIIPKILLREDFEVEFDFLVPNPTQNYDQLVVDDSQEDTFETGILSLNRVRTRLGVNGSSLLTPTDSIKPDLWHKYKCTRTGTSYVISLDGVEVLSGTQNLAPCSITNIYGGINHPFSRASIANLHIKDFNSPVTEPELLVNSTFDTDTSSWTPVNATLSVTSGELNVADAGFYSTAYQTVATEIGEEYLLRVVRTTADNITSDFGWGDTVPDGNTKHADNVYQQSTPGTEILTFTATSSTTYISLGSRGGSTISYASVSLKKVTGYATQEYFYPLDEASGTQFLDTISGNHGTWSSDRARTYIPNNSRHYKIDEGSGNIFANTLGDATTQATVTNHLEASWKEYTGPTYSTEITKVSNLGGVEFLKELPSIRVSNLGGVEFLKELPSIKVSNLGYTAFFRSI